MKKSDERNSCCKLVLVDVKNEVEVELVDDKKLARGECCKSKWGGKFNVIPFTLGQEQR